MSTDTSMSTDASWLRTPNAICAGVYALAVAAAAVAVMLLGAQTPILTALAACVAATIAIFVFACWTGNASVYDPYWSVAPPLTYAWWMAVETPVGAREWLVLALVTLWSVRLTWNCMLRWPDMGHEDFRYQDLRAQSGRLFPLVNLFGIELFPTLLVFLGCLPLLAVAQSDAPFGWIDGLAVAVTVAAIWIETLADLQLRAHRVAPEPKPAILTTGVWAWSQHPNYLGEIGFWWGLCLFGLAAGPFSPWLIAGALAMTALFAFISIPMMLARKRRRHPDYDAAVAGIPVLLPFTAGRGPGSAKRQP